MSFIAGLLVSLFVFALFILFLLGGLVRWALRCLGIRLPETHTQSFHQGSSQRQGQHSNAQQHSTSPSGKNKIFQRDSSEYVDFEEV